MVFQDPFSDEEPLGDEAPASWRPPVRCPQCHGMNTRFMTLQYEMSVYECDECGVENRKESGAVVDCLLRKSTDPRAFGHIRFND